jgi:L-ribulose-5-phosphate 4-epimerase
MGSIKSYQEQVVALAQELTRKGFLSGTGGNVSVRVVSGRSRAEPGISESSNAMVITPSNFDYLKMATEDVCVLDWALQPLAGQRKPSIESGMHAAIYQARPDVNAIIHTHQVTASAVALMGRPIPSLFDEQVRYLGRSVEIVPYGASGTGWLKSNLVRKLKNHCNAYILQNHGALALGPNPERAMFNVELLEKCAGAFLLAYYSGERLTHIPLPVREVIFAKLRIDQRSGEKATERGE